MSSHTTKEMSVAEDLAVLSTATILLSFRQPSPSTARADSRPQEPLSTLFGADDVGAVADFSRAVALQTRQKASAHKVQPPSPASTLAARLRAEKRSAVYHAKYLGATNCLLVEALKRSGSTGPRPPSAFVPDVNDVNDVVALYDEAAEDDETDDADATESEPDTTAPSIEHGIPCRMTFHDIVASRAEELREAQSALSTCRTSCRVTDSMFDHAHVLPTSHISPVRLVLPVSPHHKPIADQGGRGQPAITCTAAPHNPDYLVFRAVGLSGAPEKGKRNASLPLTRPAKKASLSSVNGFGSFPLILPLSRSVADITPLASQKTSRQTSKDEEQWAEEEELERVVVTRVGRQTKKPRRM